MDCRVNETYGCLLGESLDAGLPAWLIRFSGCNLACTYCDTRYASEEPGSLVPVSSLVEQAVSSGLGRVLITGGEPLLQSDAVIELSLALNHHGIEVLLETNGSLPLDSVPPFVTKIVDVKTPGAGSNPVFHPRNLDLLNPHDQLKFVLTSRSDYLWARESLAIRNPQSAVRNRHIDSSIGRE